MTRIEKFNKDGSTEISFLDSLPFQHLEREYSFLPFSDFRRWIPEDDPWMEFESTFPLGRLGNIKQLGFLSYTGPDPEHTYFLEYTHTRELHTQQVAAIAREIVRRNGGSPKQQEFIMIVGGLHDIATPAQGDAIKLVDKEALEEEDHWKDVLDSKAFEYLRRKGFSIDEIDDAIHNRGIYGKILDVADRIAYTMQDAHEVLSDSNLDRISTDPYTSTLRNILLHDKKVGNIYQDVAVDWKGGEVVFTDPDRLGVFLRLRTHLHLSNYMYPTNQARDTFIANMVRPFYSRDETQPNVLFTPRKLRRMNDRAVMNALSGAYGMSSEEGDRLYSELINWHPKTEHLNDENQATRRLHEIGTNPEIIVIGQRQLKGFDPGTDYKVVIGNKIVPYTDVGHEAATIEGLASSLRGVNIFYTLNDNSLIGGIARQVKLISS